MAIPITLAMTAAEIGAADSLPPHIGWMACHFSSYGTGLSNIPDALPPGSMLILNDRTPIGGHDPGLIREQVLAAMERQQCDALLLDFQRPGNPETGRLCRILTDVLPDRAAVSELYADDLPCPVFLSPAPLHVPMDEAFRKWEDREKWLEIAMEAQTVAITSSGSVFTACGDIPEQGMYDDHLYCSYHTAISGDAVRFTLFDTPQSVIRKLQAAQRMGIRRFVGLYQQLRGIEWE